MEKLLIKSNGQWEIKSEPLFKGAMKRLAPKPVGEMMSDNQDAYNINENPSTQKRSGMHILKQLYNSNPHAVKSMDGKAHVLLHRGIGPNDTEESSEHDFAPMKVHSDGSLEHGGHGMYTPDHEYASQFAGNKQPNSVWVPVSSINSSGNYINHLGENQFINKKPEDEDEAQDIEDVKENGYGQSSFDGPKSLTADHVAVKPGKYQHASSQEIKNFLNHKK